MTEKVELLLQLCALPALMVGTYQMVRPGDRRTVGRASAWVRFSATLTLWACFALLVSIRYVPDRLRLGVAVSVLILEAFVAVGIVATHRTRAKF